MIDTRPFELVSSAMMTGVALMLTLGWTATFLFVGLIAATDSIPIGAFTCCMAVPAPFAGLALQVLMRWSRRGRAQHYLAEVVDELGDGTIETGTLLLPLLQPRLTTDVSGRTVEVALRRTAGFLTSARPDGAGLLPWTMTVRIRPGPQKVPRKVGFAHAETATLGFGMLGLSGPVRADGVTVFAGDREDLASSEPVLHAARPLTEDKMALVMVGPAGLSMTSRPAGLGPQRLAEQLRQLVALLAAVEDAVAG